MSDLTLNSVFDSFDEFVSHWGGESFDKESNVVHNDNYMSKNTPRSHNYKFADLMASLQGLLIICQFDHPMLYLHLNEVIAKGTNLNSLFIEACSNIKVYSKENFSSLDCSLDCRELTEFYTHFGQMVYQIMFQSLCDVHDYLTAENLNG